MKKLIVYVEGPSDKFAMNKLLEPLLESKRQKGLSIEFFDVHCRRSDNKEYILKQVPKKAVYILKNDPSAIVVAMPDLYPKNKGFPHETFKELSEGIYRNFEEALTACKIKNFLSLKKRFSVFCFKYDMEALILAAEDALKDRLEVSKLSVSWRIPVEDQNHKQPPKRIVEKLFKLHAKEYKSTIDAPLILSKTKYNFIASKCPQCFNPFIQFLRTLK